MDAGEGEVVFGFLPAGVRPDSSRRPTRDLTLPEESHHEGLLGARPPATHQPDPACRQRAIWKPSVTVSRADALTTALSVTCGGC